MEQKEDNNNTQLDTLLIAPIDNFKSSALLLREALTETEREGCDNGTADARAYVACARQWHVIS